MLKTQNKELEIDITEVTVPTHDKLKAYLDTKAKDDPWSPYVMTGGNSGNSGQGKR